MNRRSNKLGFLLLELSIVLVLVAFMGLLILPKMTTTQSLLLRSEVERLYTFFHMLQSKAIISAQKIVVGIDTKNNQLLCANPMVLLHGACFDIPPASYGPPSNPVKLLISASSFQKECLIFYPNGTISPGCIYITNKSKTVLYALSVAPGNTSLLRKYLYTQAGWIAL